MTWLGEILRPREIVITWPETTLNYWMVVHRYPSLKEEIGGSIPRCEISSLLDINSPRGQLPLVLWRWHVGLLSLKKREKRKREERLKHHVTPNSK